MDCVPTLKTANSRICLLLPSGVMGLLRIDDAERLQARCTDRVSVRVRVTLSLTLCLECKYTHRATLMHRMRH